MRIDVTRHFDRKYLSRWGWFADDLREAIRHAYRIEKTSEDKYEIYTMKNGSKKIILVHMICPERILCITGSEGGYRT